MLRLPVKNVRQLGKLGKSKHVAKRNSGLVDSLMQGRFRVTRRFRSIFGKILRPKTNRRGIETVSLPDG